MRGVVNGGQREWESGREGVNGGVGEKEQVGACVGVGGTVWWELNGRGSVG